MYKRVKKLLSPDIVKESIPLEGKNKRKFDDEIKRSISGNGKFLLIIGPCSADDPQAVLKYCEFLKKTAERVKDKLFIVPRIYTAKPRSKVGAYRGILHSPDISAYDINGGIATARKLMADVAKNFGFFAADEMLYPELYPYFDDLISYVTIGARSSEDQFHRMFASCLDIPVGIKNPMHGNNASLVQAIKIAKASNDFAYNGYEIRSDGNKFAHAVMRGYMDRKGNMFSNYSKADLFEYIELCESFGSDASMIIDCNHFNSGKDYLREGEIALDVISSGIGQVKGLMIESYLYDGSQTERIVPGMSLTDGCIGPEKTERLIFDIAEKL